MALAVTDEAAANKLWAGIDKSVTDAAPAAILFTPKHLDFVSVAPGQFPVQQPVLLDGAAVLGPVGRAARGDRAR